MKKVGNFDSLLTAIRASANIGGDFMWEFKIKAGPREGRLLTRGDTILYAEYGDQKGMDAIKSLENFDVLTYEVQIYEGEVPEYHAIKLKDLEKVELKAEYDGLEPEVMEKNFYDLLVEAEQEGKTALVLFPSKEKRVILMAFVDGYLVGLRPTDENFSTKELLEEFRRYRTYFHILEGDFVPYMSGYFALAKTAVDTPAGSWSHERIVEHEGTLESFGAGDRILAVSDGEKLLLVMRPAVPPTITSKLLKEFHKKGRLVDAYPVIDAAPLFNYTFEDLNIIKETFENLIKESRKLVGEIIFKMASDKVLNYAHPTDAYPDEYAEFILNVYKQYETEIATFTGKRWKEIKANVLRDVPEHIAKIFGD